MGGYLSRDSLSKTTIKPSFEVLSTMWSLLNMQTLISKLKDISLNFSLDINKFSALMLACKPPHQNIPYLVEIWFKTFCDGRPSGHVDGLEFLSSAIFASTIINAQQKCALLFDLFDLDSTQCIREDEFTILLKALSTGLHRIADNFPPPPSYMQLRSITEELFDALDVDELCLYDLHVWLTESVPAVHVLSVFSPGLRSNILTHGINDRGQLGLCFGPMVQSLPTGILALEGENVVFVSSSRAHTLLLTESGKVFASGSGLCGTLGQGNTRDGTVAIRVPLLPQNIISVSTGARHSAAVTSDGRLFMWGSADWGQLGIGKPSSMSSNSGDFDGYGGAESANEYADPRTWEVDPRSGEPYCYVASPTEVLELKYRNIKVKKVVCSAFSTVILDQNGYLYGTGESSNFQSGVDCVNDLSCNSNKVASPSLKKKSKNENRFSFSSNAIEGESPDDDEEFKEHNTVAVVNIEHGISTSSLRIVHSFQPIFPFCASEDDTDVVVAKNNSIDAVISNSQNQLKLSKKPNQEDLDNNDENELGTIQNVISSQKKINSSTSDNYVEVYPKVKNIIIKDFSAGDNHFIALDQEGDVWSWGTESAGCLGRLGGQRKSLHTLKLMNLTNSSPYGMSPSNFDEIGGGHSPNNNRTNGNHAASKGAAALTSNNVSNGGNLNFANESVFTNGNLEGSPSYKVSSRSNVKIRQKSRDVRLPARIEHLRYFNTTSVIAGSESSAAIGPSFLLEVQDAMFDPASVADVPSVNSPKSPLIPKSSSNLSPVVASRHQNVAHDREVQFSNKQISPPPSQQQHFLINGLPIGRVDCWSKLIEKSSHSLETPSKFNQEPSSASNFPSANSSSPNRASNTNTSPSDTSAANHALVVKGPIIELPLPWIDSQTYSAFNSDSSLSNTMHPGQGAHEGNGLPSSSRASQLPPIGSSTVNRADSNGGVSSTVPSHAILNSLAIPGLNELTAAIHQQQPVILTEEPMPPGTWLKLPSTKIDFRLSQSLKIQHQSGNPQSNSQQTSNLISAGVAANVSSDVASSSSIPQRILIPSNSINPKSALKAPLFMPIRDPFGSYELSDIAGRICVFDLIKFLQQPIPTINMAGIPKPPPLPSIFSSHGTSMIDTTTANGASNLNIAGATTNNGSKALQSAVLSRDMFVNRNSSDDELNTPTSESKWNQVSLDELFTHITYRCIILLSQGAQGALFIMPPGLEVQPHIKNTGVLSSVLNATKESITQASLSSQLQQQVTNTQGTIQNIPQINNINAPAVKPKLNSNISNPPFSRQPGLTVSSNSPPSPGQINDFYPSTTVGLPQGFSWKSQLQQMGFYNDAPLDFLFNQPAPSHATSAIPIIVSEAHASRLADFPILSMTHAAGEVLSMMLQDHVSQRIAHAAQFDPDGIPDELKNWKMKRGEFATRSFFEHVLTGVCRWSVPFIQLPGPAVVLEVPNLPTKLAPPLVSRLRMLKNLNPSALVISQRSSAKSMQRPFIRMEPADMLLAAKSYAAEKLAAEQIANATNSATTIGNRARSQGANSSQNLVRSNAVVVQSNNAVGDNQTELSSSRLSLEEIKERINLGLFTAEDLGEIQAGTMSIEEFISFPIILISFQAAECIRNCLSGAWKKNQKDLLTPSMNALQNETSGDPFSHVLQLQNAISQTVGHGSIQFRSSPDPDAARKDDASKNSGGGRTRVQQDSAVRNAVQKDRGAPNNTTNNNAPASNAAPNAGQTPEDAILSALTTMRKSINLMPIARISLRPNGSFFTWGRCESGQLMLSDDDIYSAAGPKSCMHENLPILVEESDKYHTSMTRGICRPILAGGLFKCNPEPWPPANYLNKKLLSIDEVVPNVKQAAFGRDHSIVMRTDHSLVLSGRVDTLGNPTASQTIINGRKASTNVVYPGCLKGSRQHHNFINSKKRHSTEIVIGRGGFESHVLPIEDVQLKLLGSPKKIFAGHNASFYVTSMLEDK